jgi:secreted trypsin-like serine protease
MKRKLKRKPTLVLVPVAMLLFGVGPRAQAIMAGQAPDSPAARVNLNSDKTWSGVGSVVVNGAPLSGVVIAGRFVLTAAHVVSGAQLNAVQFVLNLGATQWTSPVESIVIHPTYRFPYDDLAVLKLANPVPPAVPIYRMFTGAQTTGLLLTLVGYGASGNGDTGVSVGANSSVKRIGENVLDALQSTVDSSGHTSRFFLYDFDGPTGNGVLGGPTIGNTVETGVAVGDSGSPVFVHNGSTPQLFGITNLVSSPTGGTVNYEFGTVGGGIIASDSRFCAWLQTATEGTLGSPAQLDVPLPLWSGVVLAFVLVAFSMRYANAAPPPIARKLTPPSWTKSAQNTKGEFEPAAS